MPPEPPIILELIFPIVWAVLCTVGLLIIFWGVDDDK